MPTAKTPRKTKTAKTADTPPQSSRENLSALIGTARQILRKDKGLNGDADRLPLLTWVMFLKFLDDLERTHEEEAQMDERVHVPIVEAPYRWRDWAAPGGLGGDDLLNFINQEQCVHRDGQTRLGLFAYLRGLADTGATGSQREVVSNIFRGVQNRMVSGGLLRDILNKVHDIHFSSSEEVHTLSHLYESMLREMRDAAGDSGEFYTPRPVVRFMVQALDPVIGETVLDPACGTGGFLVEAYEHLKQGIAGSTEQRRRLQRGTLFGQEAKPLPYMLAQMNLLLHGLEAPQIAYGNTLDRRINEIGHSERVDVILTNPPFGGEEEVGIKANFPPNMQTAETALLFLQYIMRKLRVAGAPVPGGKPATRGGRAAVVVPNGTLFGDGISAVIKEEMLKEFKLHTIVRLPQGVFAPYTDIPANLLFFERGGPTDTIWYYELPLPTVNGVGRKKYSKTAPLQFEEFAPAQAWWSNREEGPQAWKVDFAAKREAAVAAATPHWQRAEGQRNAAIALGKPIRELEQAIQAAANGQKSELQDRLKALKTEQAVHEHNAKAAQFEGDALYWPIYNLDLKNPHAKAGLEHADPKDLIAAMRSHEAEVMRLLGEIESLVAEVQA